MSNAAAVSSPGELKAQRWGELKRALAGCRAAFLTVGMTTAFINVLYLTGSFFMLEVYDRVLPSRSIPTLIGLAIIAVILYAFQGILDLIRARMLARISGAVDRSLSGRVFQLAALLPLLTRSADGTSPVRDFDQVRGFLSGLGPATLFDLPWLPLYLAVCFIFHPLIGFTTLSGALVLVVITVLNDAFSRSHVKSAGEASMRRTAAMEAVRRNAEVLKVMGMSGRIQAAWQKHNTKYVSSTQAAADIMGAFGTASKVIRLMLQSAVLGIGAWLVIRQEATAGIIIASSILASRALAPVELAISHWKAFISARQSWVRLTTLMALLPAEHEPMLLPRPTARLSLQGVTVAPPGARTIVVQDVDLELCAGSGLAIIGPSASGKSSLVRSMVGAWPILRGNVRLDGAALDQWTAEELGAHIGYLPQDVELFAGTVAQNISRFDEDPSPDTIIAAAKSAGVHDLILNLSQGYETEIGEGGAILSAGQRQRIGLARALYGEPFLVVLDEPNSNLDNEGEQALAKAIVEVRVRGGIVIVVAHRPSALSGLDQILVMAAGRAQAMGPKDEILAKFMRPAGSAAAAAAGLKLVGQEGRP
jgi:ATP-binding cassette subfamily C protein